MKLRTFLLLLAAGCSPAAAEDAPPAKPPAKPRPWIDVTGDAIVGFGLLRLVPPPGGGEFTISYHEKATDYGEVGASQLFVLPGDAFAQSDRAYAGDFLAFSFGSNKSSYDDSTSADVTFRVERETTVIVAYGPWTAPDAGRPPGDVPTFHVAVTMQTKGGAHEWIESEMGELITTNWTNRPDVKRGAPWTLNAKTGETLHLEVRPMILYDGRMVRAADEPVEPSRREIGVGESPPGAADDVERAIDAGAAHRRSDRRIVMTRALTERFRRVPIRWR